MSVGRSVGQVRCHCVMTTVAWGTRSCSVIYREREIKVIRNSLSLQIAKKKPKKLFSTTGYRSVQIKHLQVWKALIICPAITRSSSQHSACLTAQKL